MMEGGTAVVPQPAMAHVDDMCASARNLARSAGMALDARKLEDDEAERRGFLGPQTVSWRIGGERALLIGGGRAVLMQLAHPLVAAGVGQHSSYRKDPWARTFRTIELMQRLTFGTRRDALDAARTINRLHTHVRGTLDVEAGTLSSDTPYYAKQADLLLWVVATLLDTVLLLYPMLVAPLSAADQERYYQESRYSIGLLGLPAVRMPETLSAFRAYMRSMLEGDTLATTPAARQVAAITMHMPVPLPLRPAFVLGEQVTIGLLPPRLRALYGYTWDAHRQAWLSAAAASSRHLMPLVPAQLRLVPRALAAWRRVGVAPPSLSARER
jgi:uncharacterized protein (DUF2236 family)